MRCGTRASCWIQTVMRGRKQWWRPQLRTQTHLHDSFHPLSLSHSVLGSHQRHISCGSAEKTNYEIHSGRRIGAPSPTPPLHPSPTSVGVTNHETSDLIKFLGWILGRFCVNSLSKPSTNQQWTFPKLLWLRCRLNQVAAAQGFLLVWGASLHVHCLPMARLDAPLN